jgi:ankyrin repeat protein
LSDILAEPIVVQLIDWDEKNDDGKTGLHLAAQYGYADFIKVLIKNGANVMVGDANANTALHLAVQYDIESVVCSLLGNGAKVDCFDRKGWTPLHRAAEKGLHAITGHLLGATENIMCATTCDSGWTALHIAARYGHEVIVKDIAHIILQQGGNFAMEDNYGYTPFQHAKRGAHHSAANYLLETLKRTQAVPTELPEVSVKVPEDPPDGTSI